MYNIYSQIDFPGDHSFKLIQLPADVLEYIENNSGELTIKAPNDRSNHMVLCTSNKTYKLRQMNHSNSVLLSNDMSKNKLEKRLKHTFEGEDDLSGAFVSLATLSYEYEPTTTKGYIISDNLPLYDGHKLVGGSGDESNGLPISVENLLRISPISVSEFYKEWYKLGGSELNEQAILLSRNFITDILALLLTVLISEKIDYRDKINTKQVTEWLTAQSSSVTPDILNSVLQKFKLEQDGDILKLDNLAISTWFGIQSLFDTKSKTLSDQDFLLTWKSLLPVFYNVPIDLKQLRGNFCRPVSDKIQHLNPLTLLAGDIGSRIKDLFAVSKEWEYDEFLPFIEEFIPVGKKPESIVLKFARKRRVGKRSVVSQR